MSGGSHDYLCYKDPDELLYHLSMVQKMADDLARLGYAQDAARETNEVIAICHQFDARISARLQRLRPVWLALEWWHSGDMNEDGFKFNLERYRTDPDTYPNG